MSGPYGTCLKTFSRQTPRGCQAVRVRTWARPPPLTFTICTHLRFALHLPIPRDPPQSNLSTVAALSEGDSSRMPWSECGCGRAWGMSAPCTATAVLLEKESAPCHKDLRPKMLSDLYGTWKIQVSGPPSSLNNPNLAKPTFRSGC